MAPINGNAQEEPEDYIDPKGYWGDPQRNVRRASGERGIILTAVETCTKAEWMFLLESLGIGENE